MVKKNSPISTKGTTASHLKSQKDHEIWHWKSMSWLRTGTKCGQIKLVNDIPTLPF